MVCPTTCITNMYVFCLKQVEIEHACLHGLSSRMHFTFVQLYLLPLIIIAAEAASCNPSLHNNYMTFNGQNHVKLMHFL